MIRIINFINVLKGKTWPNLFINNLRIILAFGFIPSGFKKINNIPFTKIENTGAFYDYLDALYNTGFYYEFIDYAQVLAALLLFSYRFSTFGAVIFLPIILNICVFTISTDASLTTLITTLMTLATILLLLWDLNRIQTVFKKNAVLIPEVEIKHEGIWFKAGLLLIVNTLVIYLSKIILGRHNLLSHYLLLLYMIIAIAASIIFILKRKIRN